MKYAAEIVERARLELEAGRPWRAKEILGGHIAGGRIEPELLEEYGRVLELLGDRVEAGKYLFLSGARRDLYLSSIELFKLRHGRRRARDVVAQFPSAFRRQGFERIEPALRNELTALGVTPDSLLPRGHHVPVHRRGPRLWRAHLAVAIIGAVLLFLFFAMLVGLRTIFGWASR